MKNILLALVTAGSFMVANVAFSMPNMPGVGGGGILKPSTPTVVGGQCKTGTGRSCSAGTLGCLCSSSSFGQSTIKTDVKQLKSDTKQLKSDVKKIKKQIKKQTKKPTGTGNTINQPSL